MAKNETLEDSVHTDVHGDDQLQMESSFKDHFFRPAIICGICEACGSTHYVGGKMVETIDKSSGQKKFTPTGGKWETIDATNCAHYKSLYESGQYIQCSGCGEKFTGAKNRLNKFSELLATRQVLVFSFRDNPKKVIMYCDSFDCRSKQYFRLKNG